MLNSGEQTSMLIMLLVLSALVAAVVLMWNLLVRRRNAVANAFAGVDAMLQMRYDLIPNLVAVVKGYAQHESETLHAVTQLRAQAMQGNLGTNERVHIDNEISQGMGRIMATAENYPELRASENFQQLQRALNEVEERISAARRAFNAAVNDYNNAIGMFPISLLAGAADMRQHAYFEATSDNRRNPGVSLASQPGA
jgi:LemA protein